jgi:hypothetical protein
VNTEEALWSAGHKSVAAQHPYMIRNQDSEMAKVRALGLAWCKSFWGLLHDQGWLWVENIQG